eukprot:TRINITY_DN2284_c0_g2_i3.p1 TRINITY_DN2284_c0_g2~~TRINITY_DN2284_c0_g2_i3.p1  ORF type:complete len:366 (+),score=81.91 TRINITY_DN2284_c0_g2_i3:46-1143(+)
MATADLSERFQASMVLGAVGDAIGYKNGSWEFCRNGPHIHAEMMEITKGKGVNALVITRDWMVSDDTVMSLATADGLLDSADVFNITATSKSIAKYYKLCMNDMGGRAPGMTCISSLRRVSADGEGWDKVGFSRSGGGCGASMRSNPIGLVFWRPGHIDYLVAYSIESGRTTHHHPTGYLGSLITALFCSYAIQQIPIVEWPRRFLGQVLQKAKEYVTKAGREVEENLRSFSYFENSWRAYVQLRGIANDEPTPTYPSPFGIQERDEYYKSISFDGWGGASGDDSVIIAYDALLGAKGSWAEFLHRGALHSGDSDSTAYIGACWWGLVYGFEGVPQNHYKQLEYLDRLLETGTNLHRKSLQVASA